MMKKGVSLQQTTSSWIKGFDVKIKQVGASTTFDEVIVQGNLPKFESIVFYLKKDKL